MIVILGAGIIGLSLGYQLLKKGKKIKIFDTNSVKGRSSQASVGMLAPLIEAKPQEKELFNLMIESKEIWDQYRKNSKFSSLIGLKNNNSLMIALNKDDEERLKFKKRFFEEIGYKTPILDAQETLGLEPNLNSNIVSSLFCKNHDQVNPLLLEKYLITEIKKLGGEIIYEKKISKISIKQNKLFFNNQYLDFDKVVISCGAWSSEIIYNSFGVNIPVRPLKGISLDVKSITHDFYHNLWFRNIYIAPRGDGILAIGATEDERGYDSSVKMDELFFLVNSLWESFPKLEDLELKKIKVGLRPTIYDGNPVIGPIEKISPDILCNFGHYRNGILLAPVTTKIICKYIFEENISDKYNFFSPGRFNL